MWFGGERGNNKGTDFKHQWPHRTQLHDHQHLLARHTMNEPHICTTTVSIISVMNEVTAVKSSDLFFFFKTASCGFNVSIFNYLSIKHSFHFTHFSINNFFYKTWQIMPAFKMFYYCQCLMLIIIPTDAWFHRLYEWWGWK